MADETSGSAPVSETASPGATSATVAVAERAPPAPRVAARPTRPVLYAALRAFSTVSSFLTVVAVKTWESVFFFLEGGRERQRANE